jgi:hypothetical protein
MILLPDQERERLLAEIREERSRNFTAATDLTTGEKTRIVRVSPKVNEDEMSKMTAQELDEFRSRNRMKERKPPGVQQGALAVVTSVAVTQAVTETASATTSAAAGYCRVQLKRDIAEWTALQLMLNNPRRHFARQETKTKLIAFVLFYIMAALLVGIIWAAAG